MRPSTQLLLVVAFLASVAQNQASVCLDNYGNEVDWWVAIKFPNSLSYSYYLSSGSSFVQSYYDVGTAGGGPIYHTLNQIYDGDADTYVMYNDASPDGVEHYSFGHTKGVAAARDDDAFFLVQSIPKFPPPKDQGYGVESNAHYFGQSFFCMTMTKEGLEATAGQWLYTHPYIYDSYVADPTGYSNLMNVISGNFVSAATTSVQSLKTKYGVPLSYMVKTAAWDKDLYASLVAPTLQSSILVETWMDSDDPLLSQCAPNVTYSVKNVQSLSFTNTFFYEADDHSKWAISSDDILGEVCIGGINRDKSQFQRAGGTMCFQPENGLHQAMYDAIQSVAGCGYARTEENTNHIPAFTLEDSKNDRSGHPGRSEHGTAIVLGVVFGIAGVCALAIAVAFVVVRRNRNGRGLPKDTPLQQRFLSDEEAQEAKV